MLGRHHFKIYRGLALLIAVCGLSGLLYLAYFYSPSKPVDSLKTSSAHAPIQPRHAIDGFHFESIHEGRKLLSIRADKFGIHKKKLGLLSFGLMNEVRLQNGQVDIYGHRGLSNGFTGSSPAVPSRVEPKPKRDLTLADVFSASALPPFPAKRISGILIRPVDLKLHDDYGVVTRISASSARLRLTKRDIVFEGNVKVLSGSTVLTARKLRVLPEQGLLKTESPFVLETRKKHIKGENLTTDIKLSLVSG
jgi:hypothetical protein